MYEIMQLSDRKLGTDDKVSSNINNILKLSLEGIELFLKL